MPSFEKTSTFKNLIERYKKQNKIINPLIIAFDGIRLIEVDAILLWYQSEKYEFLTCKSINADKEIYDCSRRQIFVDGLPITDNFLIQLGLVKEIRFDGLTYDENLSSIMNK